MKKPYTLFKRSNGVYYVRFRDQNGERLTAVSTGSTRKSEAEVFAIDYLRQGKVDPKRSDSFRNYTKNFFDYGTSKYIKNEHRCGRSYGRRYADENKTILEKHLLPVWGDKSLSKITPVEIENYLFDVAEKYSSSRVCGIRNAIACIFKEAYHEGIIEVNPMDRVSKITARIPEKGIYSDEVIEKLFKGDALSSVWKNNRWGCTR